VADVNCAHDLRLIAEFLRQSSARSNAAVADCDRQARFVFSADAGKKMVNEMNGFDHGDLSLTMNRDCPAFHKQEYANCHLEPRREVSLRLMILAGPICVHTLDRRDARTSDA